MTVKEFKQALALGNCPFCGEKLEFYDGALGFESLRCYPCGFEVTNDGMNFMEGMNNERQDPKG